MEYVVVDDKKVLLKTKSFKDALDFKEAYYKASGYTADPHIRSYKI